MLECPLCLQTHLFDFHLGSRRHYLRCRDCYLVTVPAQFHLSPEDEKAEYDKHQNNPDDAGYRQFLSRTVTPLVSQLKQTNPNAVGLDFGCGPGPAISEMMAEEGLAVANYDSFYFPDKSLLDRSYDFVVLTEVIEHIAAPAALLQELDHLLNKGGVLAIMTKRVIDQASFVLWHYKNDPTHINFYSKQTFQWIAEQKSWRLEIIDKDVVFFHKE